MKDGVSKLRCDSWEQVLEAVELQTGLTTLTALVEAKLDSAKQARDNGDFDISLAVYKGLLQSGCGELELTCRVNLVRTLLLQSNYEGARNELDLLREKFPNEWHSEEVQKCLNQATEAMIGGNKGMQFYKQTVDVRLTQMLNYEISCDPFNADKLLQLSEFHFQHCQFELAIDLALEAVEIQGKDGDAMAALKEMLSALGTESDLGQNTWRRIKDML